MFEHIRKLFRHVFVCGEYNRAEYELMGYTHLKWTGGHIPNRWLGLLVELNDGDIVEVPNFVLDYCRLALKNVKVPEDKRGAFCAYNFPTAKYNWGYVVGIGIFDTPLPNTGKLIQSVCLNCPQLTLEWDQLSINLPYEYHKTT